MNLKTINPVALQALMSETLFSHGEEVVATVADGQTVRQEVEAEEFIYQGDKSTGILFILRYPDYPYFSPKAEEAFIKTIGALKLTPHNVAVVNLANVHNPNDFKRIMAFFRPTRITLLGVEPTSLKCQLSTIIRI